MLVVPKFKPATRGDADAVPYVGIPDAGPSDAAGPPDVAGEFIRRTGLGFGVVIWRGRTLPVIVADTGPYPKLGEGSLALHRRRRRDHQRGRRLCATGRERAVTYRLQNRS